MINININDIIILSKKEKLLILYNIYIIQKINNKPYLFLSIYFARLLLFLSFLLIFIYIYNNKFSKYISILNIKDFCFRISY